MTIQEKYLKEIEDITHAITAQYDPKKIILFGSAARGDVRDNSDIDLLIIKQSSQKQYYRTIELLNILKDVDRHLPLDPLIMTPEEFEQGQKDGRYLIRQIMKEGKVLYEA